MGVFQLRGKSEITWFGAVRTGPKRRRGGWRLADRVLGWCFSVYPGLSRSFLFISVTSAFVVSSTRSLAGPHPLSGTVVRQADTDATIGQCVVSDRYLACAVLTRHKTLSDSEVNFCLFPQQLYVLSHCRTTVSYSGSGPLQDWFGAVRLIRSESWQRGGGASGIYAV